MNAPVREGGQYVVLHHTGHGPDHYDLMLAVDEAGPLLTWRLPVWPPERIGGDVICPASVRLPDHRRRYLTYEGDIAGDRGRVRRVACGHWSGERSSVNGFRVQLDDYELLLAAD